MKVKAVIFDVYGTLLEVLPPPVDADARWAGLWQQFCRTAPRLSRAEFNAACERIIARHHAAAQAHGIPWPEVFWPDVAREAWPELASLPAGALAECLFAQAQIWHTVRLADGAADVLRQLRQRGILLGIASNAQAYTLRELREALAVHCLDLSLFEPDLCFWSFEHGFSKPDPHVFQILTARLAARGIAPGEILMVGDRADNDLEPARAHGWQTWQFANTAGHNWTAVARALA